MSHHKFTDGEIEALKEGGDPIITKVTSIDGKTVSVRKSNADEAIKYLDNLDGFVPDPAFEKKVVRKIDLALIPLFGLLMACQIMDKATLSYSSVMGMKTDLGMSGTEYSWAGSALYFGFLVFEFPANLLLQRYGLSRVLSFAVVAWGTVLMCHAACKSTPPFLACRVLLGGFEGFMDPCYILATSQWWTKEEQFGRTCCWWGLQSLGAIVGPGIAYGLAVHRSGTHSFASWRILCLVTGAITVVLGVISFLHVPNTPATAWFLNDEEKKYCVERAKKNQQGYGNHVFKKHQFIEALKDVTVWIYVFYTMSWCIPNGGFTNFGSILLNDDFGFSSTQALIMNMPAGGIMFVFSLVFAFLNWKVFKNHRLISCIIVASICVIGMCLLNFAPQNGAKLAGYYSFYLNVVSSGGQFSLMASNYSGYTKKITVNSLVFIGYTVGNIIGPQTFRANQAPQYVGAKVAELVSFAYGLTSLVVLDIIYHKRNASRERKKAELGTKYTVDESLAFADVTDFENPEFRYSY